ncbi:spore photoproduct lyase [Pelotomaculum propionicicum]|uniref:Spore photoproduct lyase n=1 Tax=Pelotomaculum propionicicum TaxID=258475 RepID=A0A4Y7RLG0_9FIRM|nr:spore photoproduct lyase [Pelotomaculum propionicicum]NLI11570.1 spore photoproduct lyase [Peptococcaceae bacterium]TEB09703.1 Spore photoproduct lyase [Pelotomaculum propionicicum]
MVFEPKRVIFEREALNYPLGEELLRYFNQQGIETSFTASHNRVTSVPGRTRTEGYFEAKRTLVVGVRRTMDFAACKPSAHFQLPLATSCPGKCEYCYLLTNLGKKPYVRVYVNIEEILSAAKAYMEKRKPEITVFEGAATSDPVPVEPYTGLLARTVEFFGREDLGRFRFVTKFTDVDTLLGVPHNGHTRFRFSINTGEVIRRYEHATPTLAERLAAAEKVAAAGYPLGFLVAPIIVANGWKEDYRDLFKTAASELNGKAPDLTFEFITHRFTKRAKNTILEVFPNTGLDLEEESRTFKFGQFGYGKYVYPKEHFAEIKEYFHSLAQEFFPQAKVEYFI